MNMRDIPAKKSTGKQDKDSRKLTMCMDDIYVLILDQVSQFKYAQYGKSQDSNNMAQ